MWSNMVEMSGKSEDMCQLLAIYTVSFCDTEDLHTFLTISNVHRMKLSRYLSHTLCRIHASRRRIPFLHACFAYLHDTNAVRLLLLYQNLPFVAQCG